MYIFRLPFPLKSLCQWSLGAPECSSLGEEATPGLPALPKVVGQDAEEQWNKDEMGRGCLGSSLRRGWSNSPATAGILQEWGGGDVGEGQQRAGDCFGKGTRERQRRAEPRTGEVRSRGIPLSDTVLRGETPGLWGGGFQSPPCFPAPPPASFTPLPRPPRWLESF